MTSTNQRRIRARKRAGILVAAALAALLGSDSASVAVTIDDFQEGPITLSRNGDQPVSEFQTGLDAAHVLGGSRVVVVGAFGVPVQTVTIDTVLGELRFSAGASHSYLDLGYGTMLQPLGVDLTADGSDSFAIAFADTTIASFPYIVFISLETATGLDNSGTGHIDATLTPYAGGVVAKVPFTAFDSHLDFTAVRRIKLSLSRVPGGRQVTLTRFATVSEPHSLFALSFGSFLLGTISSHRWRGTVRVR